MSEPTQPTMVVGPNAANRLVVQVLRRTFPHLTDYWDGNTLSCEATVTVGGFRGHVEEYMRTVDFVRFRDALRPLYNNLKGTADFQTIEQWLAIKVDGDGLGHFVATCELVDRPGIGNRLSFSLNFDQTELPALLSGLDEITAAFPVVGQP